MQSLQNASQYVAAKHTVQLQQGLNQLYAGMKLSWTSLLEHLQEAVVFTTILLEDTGEGNSGVYGVAVDKLKETSQMVLDEHWRTRDALTSISSNLLKSSRKRGSTAIFGKLSSLQCHG